MFLVFHLLIYRNSLFIMDTIMDTFIYCGLYIDLLWTLYMLQVCFSQLFMHVKTLWYLFHFTADLCVLEGHAPHRY